MKPLMLAASAAALLGACTTGFAFHAVGQYDRFSPYADLTGGRRTVEIERAGHVAVIDISALDPAYAPPFEHLTFTALYPLTQRDRTYFPAGTHRLSHEPTTELMRRFCDGIQIPTIDGCRLGRQDASRRVGGSIAPSTHYLVLVADEFIDPYTVSYYLNERLELSETLATALYRRNTQDAAAEIGETVADVPGLSAWSGYYVATRR